ncbi:hypothetical protein D3C84_1177280 [compost metagenome]
MAFEIDGGLPGLLHRRLRAEGHQVLPKTAATFVIPACAGHHRVGRRPHDPGIDFFKFGNQVNVFVGHQMLEPASVAI